MFSVNSCFLLNNNSYVNESVIKYSQVVEEDRILMEKNLNNFFSIQLPKGEISPLSGGKSGDHLYVGKFETIKLVIRIMPEIHSKAYLKQLAYSKMAAQKQLGPAVLYHNPEDRIFITEFIEGKPLLPSFLDNENVLLQLSRALHDIHHSENSIQDEDHVFETIEFNLKNCILKNIDSFKFLEKYLNDIHDIHSAIKKRNLSLKPCHNDLHMTNVFYDQNQTIKFIDWGDAGLGDPFFDLARASIEFHLSKDQTERFLNEYFSKDISLVDHAHFCLMQHLALLKIGLYFLDLPSLDEITKYLVASYFKKNEIEVDINSIKYPQDVARIIFNLFEHGILSEKFQQALLQLKQL